MSILDLAAAHEFWKNYDDPMIYRVIAFMETAEQWTMDAHGRDGAVIYDPVNRADA